MLFDIEVDLRLLNVFCVILEERIKRYFVVLFGIKIVVNDVKI